LHELSGAKFEGPFDGDDLRLFAEDVEFYAGHSHEIRWSKGLPRNDKEGYVIVQAALGGIRETLRLPRVLAVRHLALEVPRIASWLFELVAASDLVAPDSIELIYQAYDVITSTQVGETVGGGYRRNTTGSRGAAATVPRRQAVVEAGSFYRLVETATAAIDGAAILRAQARITEALSVPQRGTLRQQWKDAQDRLLCAWRLVEDARQTSSLSGQQYYKTAVEALDAASADLPGPLAAAVRESVSYLKDRPGRLPPAYPDAERIRIALEAVERLQNAEEVVRVRFAVPER
jgi:hypothetical protein